MLRRFLIFFFFKQKTAYEMRISDWSSDVCSSDLDEFLHLLLLERVLRHLVGEMPGNDHHTLQVADHDVARIDRHTAAADRLVQGLDGMVLDQVGRHRGRADMGWNLEIGVLRRVDRATDGHQTEFRIQSWRERWCPGL